MRLYMESEYREVVNPHRMPAMNVVAVRKTLALNGEPSNDAPKSTEGIEGWVGSHRAPFTNSR